MQQLSVLLENIGFAICATSAHIVTTSDVVIYDKPGIIMVTGNAGTVKVSPVNGDDITFNLETNDYVPLYVKRVYATGTTATGLIIMR